MKKLRWIFLQMPLSIKKTLYLLTVTLQLLDIKQNCER